MQEQGDLTPWLSHSSSLSKCRQSILFCQRGSEQMGQRQHHHSDIEKLQEMPQAPQQGCDPPADPQPRHLPIQKVCIPCGAAALMPGSSLRVHTVCSSLTPQKKLESTIPFHSRKAGSELAGDSTPQQKAQAPWSSSTHFELGGPKPRHQVQCLKTAEAAHRQFKKPLINLQASFHP